MLTTQTPKVHKELTADVQIGDYIHLPFVPIVRVIDRIESEGTVTFIVKAGANPPEEWKVKVEKTEVVTVKPQTDRYLIKHIVYTATPYYRQVVVNSQKPKTKAQRRAAAIIR